MIKYKKTYFLLSLLIVLFSAFFASAQAATGGVSNITLQQILVNLLKSLLLLVGTLGVIGMVIAGIRYISAVGSESGISSAKKMFFSAAIDARYVTGFYGPLTTAAVTKFQADNGLPQTGSVGPLTKAMLGKKVRQYYRNFIYPFLWLIYAYAHMCICLHISAYHAIIKPVQ